MELTTREPSVPPGDEWHGISDPYLRKRVQNRLAQRASRARRKGTTSTTGPSKPRDDSSASRSVGSEVDVDAPRYELGTEECSIRQLSVPSPVFPCISAFSDPASDTQFLYLQSMSTSNAFLFIGNMLNLACTKDMSVGYNIRAPLEILPTTLKPTSLQTTVPHWPYVDMIPWPSLRDRILNSLSMINEDELIHDIAVTSSWRVWGSAPWDPMSWEIDATFAQKWWCLLDDGVVRTANFWRMQRGEAPLSMVSAVTSGIVEERV